MRKPYKFNERKNIKHSKTNRRLREFLSKIISISSPKPDAWYFKVTFQLKHVLHALQKYIKRNAGKGRNK